MKKTLEERVDTLEQNGIPGVRDFFATSALSILANYEWISKDPEQVAKKAYRIADAMIKERDNGHL